MSTKIYNAIRISKENDIKSIIKKMKDTATNIVANDGNYLYALHAVCNSIAKKDEDINPSAKAVIEEHEKNEFTFCSLYWISKCLKNAEDSFKKDFLDVILKGCVSFDDNYWYMKFFCNNGITQKMFDAIEKLEGVEDFHYQNQCDPPEDINEDEYEKRNDKWKELIPDDKYSSMPLEITVFDINSFEELIKKNWWNGIPKEELYNHLAYKFDKAIPNK